MADEKEKKPAEGQVPAAGPADPAPAEAPLPEEAADGVVDAIERNIEKGNQTVLVVDDERAIRKVVSRGIKESDERITVFEAANGKMALEILDEIRTKFKHDPLFIVTDLNMPVMDGWEFIEHLRKENESKGQTQGTPIVVLSSTTGEKGHLLFRKSVHGTKSGYSPIITVAKEACISPRKYDAVGEKGLLAWIKYFVSHA